ncbi:hypothetical protein ACLB1E_03320 [Escherichia coli]
MLGNAGKMSHFSAIFLLRPAGELPIMPLIDTADVNHLAQTAGFGEEKNSEIQG